MTPTSATRRLLTEDESIKAEIRVSVARSTSAFNRGDVETILGSYVTDAVVLPPRSPAVQGLPEIRQLVESLLAAGYHNSAVELDRIEHWGNVALAIGRYKMQISDKSASSDVDRGKYVGHWRRMSDGQFRMTLNMWNSDRWRHADHP